MTAEATTYSGVARVIVETLETHYGVDPKPLFQQAGLDPAGMLASDFRYPTTRMFKLWEAAEAATGDPCVGLVVGFNVRPTTFHALGFSWLASATMLGALRRLRRFYRVIATVPADINIELNGDSYELDIGFPDPRYPTKPLTMDAFLASIVKLCRTATNEHFHPLKVLMTRDDPGRADEYIRSFAAPVQFNTDKNALFFDRALLEAPVPGRNIGLARETDKILDRYLEALEPDRVASEVKHLLLRLLPSGQASQLTVASRMNRSTSTLQRQLRAEGTNYREICDGTRKSLAEQYVRDGEYSLGEIAYQLGFTDQSNFSRAFKRWTGVAPGEFGQ
jgi:AraC-like DNA-binding protein